jgi:hypothetical protein
MQLMHTPVALPGCCFICRGAQRESYIDTGVQIDYEGAFYICNLCINEAAHIMAFISHDEYKDLRKSKEELEHINYELIKRVGALEESLSALANAGYRLNDDRTVVVSGGAFLEAPKESATESPGGEEGLGDGEIQPLEQVYDEGMGDLRPSSDSDDESEFELKF